MVAYPGPRRSANEVAAVESRSSELLGVLGPFVTTRVIAIDNQPILPNTNEVELLPGIHKLTLIFEETWGGGRFTFTSHGSAQVVVVRVVAGRKYKLRGQRVGDDSWSGWVEDAETGTLAGGVKREIIEAAKALAERRADIRSKFLGPGFKAADEGNFDDAEKLLKSGITEMATTVGPKDSELAAMRLTLADIQVKQGRLDEARSVVISVLPILTLPSAKANPAWAVAVNCLAKIDPGHPLFTTTLSLLVIRYRSGSNVTEQQRLLQQALDMEDKAALEPRQARRALWRSELAGLYFKQGRLSEAEAIFLESLQSFAAASGVWRQSEVNGLMHLTALYQAQGRLPDAEAMAHQLLDLAENTLGTEEPAVATILQSYSELLRKMGKLKEAVDYQARAENIRSKAAAEHGNQGGMSNE
jgi:tetratricopeptide (TPR) repeat protein